MAIHLKPVDVAVIGLGAAGGVAVLPLARADLKIVGIEAGTWMDPRSFRPDEIHNNVRNLLTSVPKAQREIPTFRTTASTRAQQAAVHPMMNAIGGTSIHYWAQSWRYHPWDFRVRSEVTRRYGASAIPAGSTLEDWPLAYDELERFYDLIEHQVGVSGKAGNIQGKIDPRGNIFEGPRQREYPMPPLRDSEFTDLMMTAGKKLGWHPFRGPAAINSQPYRGRPACALHGYCDKGGCHVSAKNSTAVTTIPEALKTKHQCTTFPYENTFLDLDPEVKDPLGDPVCRVTSGPKQNEPRAMAFAHDKMEEWFRAAGAMDVIKTSGNGPALSTHALGGTRMGDDPDTNVVDRWGFAHEAPNLGILGGSVIGTSGARNPTLSIQALAWRTAEHLINRWKSIGG